MSNINTDELTQQIATAIAPIIEDYVNSQIPDPGTDPDPGDIDIDKIVAEVIAQIDLDREPDIDLDELADRVADRIGEVNIDELANLVADRIDIDPNPTDGLTEAEVIALIEQHAPAGDNGTGDWDGDLPALVEEVTNSLNRLQVSYDPENVGEMLTGTPDGQMHSSTGWGPVYEAEQRCHLRGTVVDAAERGTVTFRFYELSTGDADPEIADEPYRTREIDVESGEQYIPLEVTLEEGYYFVEKDAHLESGGDEVIPLRRAAGVDPEDVNDSDVPLKWLRGFHPDYRESVDSSAYDRYISNEWYANYHYCFQVEVGYNNPVDGS
jgi:hypothetical protein